MTFEGEGGIALEASGKHLLGDSGVVVTDVMKGSPRALSYSDVWHWNVCLFFSLG